MTSETLKKTLKRFEEAERENDDKANLSISKDKVKEICESLKDIGMEHLSSLSVVDMENHLNVVYHLANYNDASIFKIKIELDPGNPTIPSVTSIWDYAAWYEREAAEMFGIKFEGHPNHKRLLLSEKIKGQPLRKDFPLEGEE